MHCLYERALSHKGVNYHLWSTKQDSHIVYALTGIFGAGAEPGTIFPTLEGVV